MRKTISGIMLALLIISMLTMLFDIQLIRSVRGDSVVDYMLCEHHGGWWCDAEKTADDTEDDLMCWALTATNVLEWTGWGLVGGMWNTDEMFEYSQGFWDDHTGSPPPFWHWWFDGTGADHAGGGNFWPGYTWTNYLHATDTSALLLEMIDDWLHDGYGIGLWVGNGAHYITCWGFRYDDSFDKHANPNDYYLGVWVTNSDDDKNWIGPAVDAPNTLDYYTVDWNGTHWNMGGGFAGWHIGYVCAFEPFPDNNRPVANAGGPYTGDEGSPITFDGSGSSDPDGDTLQYRWDFDNDGLWDTAWSSSPYASHTWYDDYTGTVILKVHDSRIEGSLMDGATATVTVNNEAPTVNAGPDQTVNEGDTVSFSGSFTDPGTDDTHTREWDFGEGSTASGTLTPTHVYGDNGVYTVTLTVTDDDGGVDTDTLTVTVENVPPSITPFGPFTVDEGMPVTLAATSTDPGSDDLTFTWGVELGPTVTSVYFNNGINPDPYPSPWGTYPFSATDYIGHTYGDNGVYTVTLTVEDDDGGSTVYTTTVTVDNVAPSISELAMTPPNPENPEYILPIVHEPLFTAPATDPGSDDLTFTWDWGDGTDDTTTYYNDGSDPDPYPSPWGTYPFSSTDEMGHIYSEPGTYTVTLTVEDDDGGVDTATHEITILSAEEAKHIINDYIQALPDDAFKGNPNQRKNAFDNMFSAIDDMLDDEEYNGAIQHLQNNIREKTDEAVGGSPKNDWIKDPTAQEHICWKIDALIAYLETLI